MTESEAISALEGIERSLREFAGSAGTHIAPVVETKSGTLLARSTGAFVQSCVSVDLIELDLLRRRHRARRQRRGAFVASSMSDPMALLSTRLYGAREETLRLIDQLVRLTLDIEGVRELLRDPQPGKSRQLDKKSAVEQRRILENEQYKVERLEAVLSVVGTVKAGKSTVVNAIVGMELMPNRKLPMTTYPTFIRHDESCLEPRLSIPMAGAFTALIRELRPALSAKPEFEAADEVLGRLSKDIESGKVFEVATFYEGRDAVMNALELVNDLTRLASLNGLEAPVPSESSAAAFPAISVRFAHLPATSVGQGGRIALLDTPGPNEAGIGDALREIVSKAIAETSATLLVADFTQLKVEAADELQALVRDGLFDVVKRVFVFVNKFDEARSRDWSAEETKANVSKLLLNGEIPPERIFPVSALGGFLANAARRELESGGSLPDTWWAKDFAREFAGAGKAGERAFEDNAFALETAITGWSESGLEAPLREVISHAAKNAAIICLDAALEKVVQHSKTTYGFLGLREAAVTQTAEQLKIEVAELGEEITQVEIARAAVLRQVDEAFTTASKELLALAAGVEHELLAVLSAFLQSRRMSLTPEAYVQAKEQVKKWKKGQRANLKIAPRVLDERHRDPLIELDPEQDSELMLVLERMAKENPTEVFSKEEFTTEAEALAALKAITGQVSTIIKEADVRLSFMISQHTQVLGGEIEAGVQHQLAPILSRAAERLKKNFDVPVSFPGLGLVAKEKTAPDLIQGGALRAEQRTGERLKERDTRVSKAQRFAGKAVGWLRLGGMFKKHGEWGHEKVTYKLGVYVVDRSSINDQVQRFLGGFTDRMNTELQSYVREPVRQTVDQYFADLADYLDSFRNDLGDALVNKNLAAEELQALYVNMKRARGRAKEIMEFASITADGVAQMQREP